jgi:hypothetical protein
MYNSIISHKTVIFITTTANPNFGSTATYLPNSRKQTDSTMYSCTLPDKKYDDSYLRSYHHKNPKPTSSLLLCLIQTTKNMMPVPCTAR